MDTCTITDNGKTAQVLRKGGETIASALFHGAGCVPVDATGRGAMLRFPFESGFGFVRTCLRGGVVRHFMRDGYLLVNRPLREFRMHAQLYEMGLAVPEPLGVCWWRSGLVYRGAFATREIPGASLFEYLGASVGVNPETLRGVGALVRQFHDRGVFHADLQVRNILVNDAGAYLIDFDQARLGRRLSGFNRARNLLRLRRSLDKNGFSREYFDLILEGYGPGAVSRWMNRLYEAKGKMSDSMFGPAEKS